MATRPEVDWIGLYLLEDLGPGDVTSDTLLAATQTATCRMVAREEAVMAGGRHAGEVFRRLGATWTQTVPDGEPAARGAVLGTVHGPTRAVLAGERVALNLVGRMAGIASLTRQLQQRLSGRARFAATRKTTPGFRAFEKEAVSLGGGETHRMGLWDAAMVKDNHRAACGGDVAAAVRLLRERHPGLEVCCEVESLPDALHAAAAGAHWILIDNQTASVGKDWATEVRRASPGVRIEASGGIRPDDIEAFAWADRVSLGWLTQKAPAKDIGLDWG